MNRILEAIPFETERSLIRLLREDDIDWYIKTINKPFFNEFVDIKACEKYNDIIKEKLLGLIRNWMERTHPQTEIRTVVSFGGELAGGLTVFRTGNGVYDLGYWVIPAYQGRGIGLEILRGITTLARGYNLGVRELQLTIQEDNERSIRIAKKAGYRLIGQYEGIRTTNFVYRYTIDKKGR